MFCRPKDALLVFFEKLEASPYYIRVEGFDLKTPLGAINDSSLKLTVKLYVDKTFNQ